METDPVRVKRKVCPISGNWCVEETCALQDDNVGGCALLGMSNLLNKEWWDAFGNMYWYNDDEQKLETYTEGEREGENRNAAEMFIRNIGTIPPLLSRIAVALENLVDIELHR